MNELPLVFVGGLLGSSHCVGMCGGFALMLGLNQRTARRNVASQLVYSFGRVFTYSVLGGIAGFASLRLSKWGGYSREILAAVSLLAGLFLIVEGLSALGLRLGRRTTNSFATGGCAFSPFFSSMLRLPGLRNAFGAGMLTGLLPCGLVYAFLSMAAASGDLFRGMGIMILFGLGTIPLMVLAGLGGKLLGIAARQRMMWLAALCVVITGCVTAARGATNLHWPHESQPAANCPFCPPTQQ